MDLTRRLAALREAEFQGEVRAAYAGFMDMLGRAEIAAHVLAPGAPMPDFLLPNAEGRLLSSGELLESGPLVVVFFRGDWCPFCMMMLSALEEVLPELHAAGATLVAMTPDTGGRALRAKQAHGLHCEVLSDVDNEAAMQFGVVVNPPESYRALYIVVMLTGVSQVISGLAI
jgi:peroxiredoxin